MVTPLELRGRQLRYGDCAVTLPPIVARLAVAAMLTGRGPRDPRCRYVEVYGAYLSRACALAAMYPGDPPRNPKTALKGHAWRFRTALRRIRAPFEFVSVHRAGYQLRRARARGITRAVSGHPNIGGATRPRADQFSCSRC